MPPFLFPWHWLTRLGEAQILLPAMALVSWWLWHCGSRRLVVAWCTSTLVAIAITTSTKVAFLGWGVGYADWDFTGVSGHAMFSAAILPVLAYGLATTLSRPGRWSVTTTGFLLAIAVAVSRVMVDAHSVSESVVGFCVGATAALSTLRWGRPASPIEMRAPRWGAALVAAWMGLATAAAPPSRSHDMVTEVAVQISGRALPFDRPQRLSWPTPRSR